MRLPGACGFIGGLNMELSKVAAETFDEFIQSVFETGRVDAGEMRLNYRWNVFDRIDPHPVCIGLETPKVDTVAGTASNSALQFY
jgi:hypothetical protein